MTKKILAILLILTIILSVGCSSNSSNTHKFTGDRSIETKIESYGYNVKGLIDSDDSNKYYCYIDGNVSVVNVSSSEIVVSIYDNDNMLIDAFVIDR